MSIFAVMAGLALSGATGSLAADDARSKDDGDRMVCQVQTPTGTRFKKKLCMKLSEREAMRRNAQDSINRAPGINGSGDSNTAP